MPCSRPSIKTTSNSSPFAWCKVINVTFSCLSSSFTPISLSRSSVLDIKENLLRNSREFCKQSKLGSIISFAFIFNSSILRHLFSQSVSASIYSLYLILSKILEIKISGFWLFTWGNKSESISENFWIDLIALDGNPSITEDLWSNITSKTELYFCSFNKISFR